ncbi:hypothetical protein [Arvimicrobium flavum]|uniref:hypothetical protein n=1 Tax=Arvimicrobium flavum TaxID=3393320 RepID=UPI00237A0CC6|nr:hypothetical protein [Mesorhizobium shangrilense]
MHFDLITTDPALQPLVSDYEVPTVEPLPVSSWVAASVLQKSVRRGDIIFGLRAAATLLKSDPAKLWRRLAGIVFEDVGLGDLDCVRLVMAASGKSVRQQHGGEWPVAARVVTRMCEARKCRATDDMFLTISHHHELDELRASQEGADLSEHLSRIRERGALLGLAGAALNASGVRWTGRVEGKAADAGATFAAMREAGVEHDIVALAEQGFRRTREALPLLLPLLTLALPSGVLPAQDDEFPPVVIGPSGIPTYCYDAFSWEGKSALSRFLKRNTRTGRWLRRYFPAERRLTVLAGGLFRIEGGLVRQRVEWPCAMTLRWLADSGYHNMKLSDPAGFLDMIRADLPTIDMERANVR